MNFVEIVSYIFIIAMIVCYIGMALGIGKKH